MMSDKDEPLIPKDELRLKLAVLRGILQSSADSLLVTLARVLGWEGVKVGFVILESESNKMVAAACPDMTPGEFLDILSQVVEFEREFQEARDEGLH